MYHSDAKFNRFGGLNKRHNVVQFKIRDKTTSPSIIGITAKADPTTSCSSSSNSSIDPFEFPTEDATLKKTTTPPDEEDDNIFDFPDTEQETLEVKLMVASMRAIPQNSKKPKKRISPATTPKSLSSTTHNSLKSNIAPRIEATKKPAIKVPPLKKKIQPPLSNQMNKLHTANDIMHTNNRVMPPQLQQQQQQQQQQWIPQPNIQLHQQWIPQPNIQLHQQLSWQQQEQHQDHFMLQQQREQFMLQQQREQFMPQQRGNLIMDQIRESFILEQQQNHFMLQQREQLLAKQRQDQMMLQQLHNQALIQKKKELAKIQLQKEQQERQQFALQQQQQQFLLEQQFIKERAESSFDIFDFDYNPTVIIKHKSNPKIYNAGQPYTKEKTTMPVIEKKVIATIEKKEISTIEKKVMPIIEKKRKRNVVAQLKTARGETTQAACFDFLSDEEEPNSGDLLPLREIKERSKSPELTYAERMELELESMTQKIVIPTSESKRVEYKPQNKMNVKITFSKK